MQMRDIQCLTLVAGPTKIAYHFYPASGEFVIWIGEQVKMAPVTAQKTTIPSGFTEWTMEDEE